MSNKIRVSTRFQTLSSISRQSSPASREQRSSDSIPSSQKSIATLITPNAAHTETENQTTKTTPSTRTRATSRFAHGGLEYTCHGTPARFTDYGDLARRSWATTTLSQFAPLAAAQCPSDTRATNLGIYAYLGRYFGLHLRITSDTSSRFMVDAAATNETSYSECRLSFRSHSDRRHFAALSHGRKPCSSGTKFETLETLLVRIQK